MFFVSNEDKILTLIEKMYTEFAGRFEKIETNVTKIEANMATKEDLMATKEDLDVVRQSLARIEQDQGSKISALFDAREIQLDVNERIFDTLTRIEGKLDKLSLKVAHHDNLLRKTK
jgi:hypothetical protein